MKSAKQMVQSRMSAKMASVHTSRVQSGKPTAITHKSASKANVLRNSGLSAVKAGIKKGSKATQQPRVASKKASTRSSNVSFMKSAPSSYKGTVVNIK